MYICSTVHVAQVSGAQNNIIMLSKHVYTSFVSSRQKWQLYICDRPREKGPFVVARINREIGKIHEISVKIGLFKNSTRG